MESLPVSSNDLGLKNIQQSFGYALLGTGGILAILVLIRLLLWRSESLDIVQTVIIGAIGLIAVRRLYVGMCIALSILVDTIGPAPIEGDFSAARELLRHRRIWTYERPPGLIGHVYYRFFPQFIFLTPPYRALLRGLAVHALITCAALGAVAYLGLPAAPSAFFVLLAGVGRVMAVREAISTLPPSQPAVDVYEHLEHLTRAGNPIDLFNHMRMSFEQFRERDFQNRVICDRAPIVSLRSPTNRCDADLVVETQPMPLEVSRTTPRAASILDLFGVILECSGGALILFASQASSQGAFWGVITAGVLSMLYGSRLLAISQAIHFTFRFRSELVWLHCEGSYLLNTVSVGGGLTGLPASEGHTVKSNLVITVRATRVITECSPASGSLWRQILGTAQPAERTLQHLLRYVVSAQRAPVFGERLDHILKDLCNFRDDASILRTPRLQSDDAQELLRAQLQLNELMNATEAQGAAQGENMPLSAPIDALLPPPASQPSPAPPPICTSDTRPTPAAAKRVVHAPPPPPPGKKKGRTTTPDSAPAEPIHWSCRKCGRQIVSPIMMAGKRLKCSSCGEVQRVPRAST